MYGTYVSKIRDVLQKNDLKVLDGVKQLLENLQSREYLWV